MLTPPNTPRTLVLGSLGQLGIALQEAIPNATFATRADIDLADAASIDAFDWTGFSIVINAAAYTAVDAAETEEGSELAWAINARAVEQIAAQCQESGATLVHISSDYVFDGETRQPYLETHPFNALGIYGQTKAAGDLAVGRLTAHYIVRTSWVIGEGNNFVQTMAALAEQGVAPSVVNDQIGRLTFTQDLADGIIHLLSAGAAFGTYNLSNEGPASSWADIAAQVFELTGHDPSRVTGVTTEEYFAGKSGIAPRPLWSMLDLSKIESTGYTPASWEQRLKDYLS